MNQLKNGDITYHKHRGVRRIKMRGQSPAVQMRKKMKIINDLKKYIISKFDVLTIDDLVNVVESVRFPPVG